MTGDPYAGLLGRFYSYYIQRPRVGRLVGRLFWDSDFVPMYQGLCSLADLPAAATVLDVPCGAGLALRWLDPGRSGRYLGVDCSPSMLARTRRTAGSRGFGDIKLHLADVTAIPLADASVDVCLLYNGLHCVDDPPAAVAEVVRCLRRGGSVQGSMLVCGASPRADRALSREARRSGGMMRAGGTTSDLQRWLDDAGLHGLQVSTSGALAVFSAIR